MARKIGQIVRRGSSTWLVRIYVGRNPETRKRRYIGKFIHGGLRSALAAVLRLHSRLDSLYERACLDCFSAEELGL